jgi:hypothetical protein
MVRRCPFPGLEDAALWVDQRNALAAELESTREIGRVEHSTS